MFNKKTQVSSQGQKIKKFKMPTFPSALVITFFVLLFVVFLSWIPHKGWVDTTNPFIVLNGDGLYGPNEVQLGYWSTSINNWNNLSIYTPKNPLVLKLTPIGGMYLYQLLNSFDLVKTSMTDGIKIDTIILGIDGDWNQVAINYSEISFNFTIGSLSGTIELDKVFETSLIRDGDNITGFSFNVLSGTVFIEEGKDGLSFASGTVANDWFNFWGSNYYLTDDSGRYGILNIPFVLLAGLFSSAGVVLYLFCIGAFVEVMLQSGALEAGTSSLVKKLQGKELLLIPVLFTMFCLGGTAFGMQEETLGLIPLIIPFLVLAGFDTMTGLIIVVVGTTSGISASVLDPFSVGVMSSSLSTPEVDADLVSTGTGMVIRIIMFLAFVIAGSGFCTWYGNRSRKGREFVAEPEQYEKNKEWAHQMLGESHANHTGLDKRQAIGLGIFIATFGMMAFSLLPWTVWFEGLETNSGWVTFSSLFFAKVVFGNWYFIQLSFMFLLIAFVLGWVFEMKPKETNKAVYQGMKGMIGLALILAVSRGVEIVLSYSGLTTGLVAMMFSGSGGGDFGSIGLAWILYPVFAFLAVFISSTSGLAAITGPLISPMLWQLSGRSVEAYYNYAIIVMVTYPLAQGTINMFMPTTGLVIAQAEVAKVNFGKALPLLAGLALGTMLIGMSVISLSILVM